jgi:hypothetical protein
MTENGEFKNLGDGSYQLSDGRIMTEAELDQALDIYLENAELKDAMGYALRNRDDLTMLYQAIAVASRRGASLKNPAAIEEAKKEIDTAHGEVLGDTFANAVADVKPMSAVTLAAMMPDFEAAEREYREAAENGLTAPKALVKSRILIAPHFIEGVTTKNFVQALIVASIVKWIPIRGYADGKRFFVNPASKDWDVLRRLEATTEGQDWIDMAYARSEQDGDEILPN